jgi:hypothetical protein
VNIDDILEIRDGDDEIIKSFKLKDSLSLDVFEEHEDFFIMREDIRNKLLQIANEFLKTIDIDLFVYDVIMVGSLSNYNWSNYSDIDLHIVVNINDIFVKDNTIMKSIIIDFFKLKKSNWNKNHNIKIKDYDVELYIQDISEKSFSGGIYSILNNNWLIKPKKEIPIIDKSKILEKSEFFCNEIEKLEQSVNIEEVDKLVEKIKKFRKGGLETGGEFSYENLTFKLLRRNKCIEKLFEIKKKMIIKKYSIK